MDFLFRPTYTDLAAQAPIAISPSPPGFEKGASGLPPLHAGHRRSQSDILLALSSQPSPQMPPLAPVTAEALAAANNSTLDGILGAYMGPKGLVTVASSGPGAAQERRVQQDSQVPAWSPADSSENEADSADGGLPRHCRSLSADSFVGKLTFGAMGLEPSNLPPPSPGPPASAGLARSGSGSIGGAAALFAKEFARMGFSEADRKKIMDNELLAKMVLNDPKKVKRILNNRLSAAKSKERKVRYITELERKVQVLQSETTTLTSQVNMLQRGHSLLSTHNNEMKIRLQAMEQQAQLKDALNEALASEVQRLKLVAGETSDPQMPNASDQQMGSRMIQLHQLLKKPSKDQQDQQQKWI
uniref:Uncharacterized protein n=1 Tax=Avena sativa TaxID=4498 RepID=A0ACD5Y7C3_AVESA